MAPQALVASAYPSPTSNQPVIDADFVADKRSDVMPTQAKFNHLPQASTQLLMERARQAPKWIRRHLVHNVDPKTSQWQRALQLLWGNHDVMDRAQVVCRQSDRIWPELIKHFL